MSFNFCTSTTIIRKMGTLADNAVTSSNAVMAEICDEAEAKVLALLKEEDYDYITNYSSMDANKKLLLQAATSKLGAREGISRCINAYASVAEAQTLMDHLKDSADDDIELIKDKDVRDDMK